MTDTVQFVPAGGGETVWVLRDRVTFGGRLPGADLVVAEVEVPPRAGTFLHGYPSPELPRVLAGEVEISMLDGNGRLGAVRAAAGDLVSLPAHGAHGYRNAGDATAVLLAVFDQSLERFFREVGLPEGEAPGGPPTEAEIDRVLAAAEAHGMRLFPAPPQA